MHCAQVGARTLSRKRTAPRRKPHFACPACSWCLADTFRFNLLGACQDLISCAQREPCGSKNVTRLDGFPNYLGLSWGIPAARGDVAIDYTRSAGWLSNRAGMFLPVLWKFLLNFVRLLSALVSAKLVQLNVPSCSKLVSVTVLSILEALFSPMSAQTAIQSNMWSEGAFL